MPIDEDHEKEKLLGMKALFMFLKKNDTHRKVFN
jgi:hypothetical protein